MINKEFVKLKSEFVLDADKFHVGCAYYVQTNMAAPWVGILISVDDCHLTFIADDAFEPKVVSVDNLINSNNGYNLTLLVPASDKVIEASKQELPIIFENYMNKSKRSDEDVWI